MIKKIIPIAIILISSVRGFSQTVIITQDPPAAKPPVEGISQGYTISYHNLPSVYNFVVTVDHGTFITSNSNLPQHIDVTWNCLETTGTITVTETVSNTPFTFNTIVTSFLSSTTYCSIGNPPKQNLLLGQTPAELDVTFCSPNCVIYGIYTFKWQVGDVAIGPPPQVPPTWTDIAGEEKPTYQPPTYNVQCIKAYRRITSYEDKNMAFDRYSDPAVISTFDVLVAGTISWTNVFNNGIPIFTQTPATGGLCDGYNYVYTWEKSFDGINYSSIGTGINYPLGAQITGSCFVRRRVDCGGQTLYTNTSQIIVQTLLPGSITGGGAYPLNTIPPVSQTPASGGVCSTPDYIYTWERSINNGTWVTFWPGTNNPAYPMNAGVIATCQVRRKVHCVYADAYSNIITFTMLPYTSNNTENLNYVRINNITIPAVQSWEQADVLATGGKLQTTSYLDDFGRSMQTVTKQGSLKQSTSGNLDPDNIANYQDLVSHVQYDGLGRADKGFLPYATTTSLGFYKTNAVTEQQSFVNTKYNEPTGSNFTYAQTIYDGSPMNRVINEKLPGYYWNTNVGYKGMSSDYAFNKQSDNIRIWDITFTPGSVPSSPGVYDDNLLVKNIIRDETDKLIVTYTDKSGNVILKRVQEASSVSDNNNSGWLNTYYVYDDFGGLRYTITPKAVAAMVSSGIWNIDPDMKKDLCFYQEYDSKGRVIVKHSPDGGEVWLVYDKRNRLVLSQDENQRNRPSGKPSQWTYTLYDDVDRNIVTGIMDDLRNRATMQSFVDGLLLQNEQVSIYTGSIWETVTAYNPVAGKKPAGGYYCVSCLENYTNSLKYYDEYPSSINKPYISLSINDFAPTNNQYVEQSVKSSRTKGIMTATKVRVLDENYDDGQISNDKFLSTINYIDEKGRIIQSHKENILTGTDLTSVQYDFSGRILSTNEKHKAPGNTFDDLLVVTKIEYDLLGRGKKLWRLYTKNNSDISNFPTRYKKLNELALDNFGRTKTKQFGEDPASPGNPMEIEDITYNIQGWLTGINKDYALADGNPNNSMSLQWTRRFGMYLGYENGNGKFAGSQWNGSVTGVIWRSQGDNTPRKYNYEYDNINRFTAAKFLQKDNPQANDNSYSTSKVDLSAFVTEYDPNGNIRAMKQMGITPGTMGGIPIDDLTYVYQNNDKGNKLYSITDNAFPFGSLQNGTQGDFKNSGTSSGTFYDYDFNGNLKTDINKNILAADGGIVTNFLDLPQQITVHDKSKTEYIYDAGGNKLAKKVTLLVSGSPPPKTTYYAGNFVYEAIAGQPTELQYILNPEGKLRITDVAVFQTPQGVVQAANTGNVDFGMGTKWGVWDYYVKDNLGNTRMVLTEEGHTQVMNCSMEDNPAALGTEEQDNFGNATNNEVLNTRTTGAVSGWNSNTTKASKLQPVTGTAVGPNVILKVMAGDYIMAGVDHFYLANTPAPPDNTVLNNVVQSLFGALTGSNNVNSGVKSGIDQNYLQNNPNSPLPPFLNWAHPPSGTKPRAYINYVFFDEQFRYVQDGSNATPVGNAGSGQPRLFTPNIQATKNGYVYVYLSNETPNMPVYFDNFTVTHARGPIVEDNAYYPYGLKIQGISASAAGKLKTKEGYQGDHSQHDDETGYNEFALRNYDPQIGRWVQVDPRNQFPSGFIGMGNNPINNVDPDGGSFLSSITGTSNIFINAAATTISGALIGGVVGLINGDEDAWKKGALIGLGVGIVGSVNWSNSSTIVTSTAASTIRTTITLAKGYPVEFRNRQGQVMTEIPEIVKKLFRMEYGIEVVYNQGHLQYGGNASASGAISSIAYDMIMKLLTEFSPPGAKPLYFGYKISTIDGQILGGVTGKDQFDMGPPYIKIDLDDFNEFNLMLKGTITPPAGFPQRANNLGRIIEHEWLGHEIRKLGDNMFPSVQDEILPGQVEIILVNKIREQLGVPVRINYGKILADGTLEISFGVMKMVQKYTLEGYPLEIVEELVTTFTINFGVLK